MYRLLEYIIHDYVMLMFNIDHVKGKCVSC
jgi:hypothetical protein